MRGDRSVERNETVRGSERPIALPPREPRDRNRSTIKDDRLQIRVNPADKALLERAAAASHLNVSSFVVQAAALRAEQVLAERSSIRLSPDAAAAFSNALEQPAEVNERLAAALRRTRKFRWLD